MDPLVLQNRLGHVFKDATLLQQALTHRSHSSLHNERLEFLGDSILNCVVASLLFDRYNKIDEGDLSRLRANLVKQQSLYEIAQRLDLSQFLRLGEGELKSGGFRRPSILADTLEALFGAIFLDAGFDAARDVIRSLYIPILDTVDPKTLGKDAKTLLQEYLQGKKIPLPQYNVVATHGAAHNQEFEIECLVPKLEIQVFGTGGSRRAGEQAAAKLALEAVQAALVKTPASTRKPRARTTQLKLAGIATIQPDAPSEALPLVADAPAVKAEKPASLKAGRADAPKSDAKTESKADSKADVKAEPKADAKVDAKAEHKVDNKDKADPKPTDGKSESKASLAAADRNDIRSEAQVSPAVTQSKTA
ncbi:ribonuclease III [Herbaspirillum sp. RV1423]|uniref:ribonuclease III n=1 Tax=Herbaspirillum sp. RV1423 TaxID=1443993 RepID=UPI0004B3AE1C|nr:ribonuclease III [Herbaspirillum sp. RV1423]